MNAGKVKGLGTKEKPWLLMTPPGTSDYMMYRDETADPPALVCMVGKTQLRYHLTRKLVLDSGRMARRRRGSDGYARIN